MWTNCELIFNQNDIGEKKSLVDLVTRVGFELDGTVELHGLELLQVPVNASYLSNQQELCMSYFGECKRNNEIRLKPRQKCWIFRHEINDTNFTNVDCFHVVELNVITSVGRRGLSTTVKTENPQLWNLIILTILTFWWKVLTFFQIHVFFSFVFFSRLFIGVVVASREGTGLCARF